MENYFGSRRRGHSNIIRSPSWTIQEKLTELDKGEQVRLDEQGDDRVGCGPKPGEHRDILLLLICS
jgi:hypothetical protein